MAMNNRIMRPSTSEGLVGPIDGGTPLLAPTRIIDGGAFNVFGALILNGGVP